MAWLVTGVKLCLSLSDVTMAWFVNLPFLKPGICEGSFQKLLCDSSVCIPKALSTDWFHRRTDNPTRVLSHNASCVSLCASNTDQPCSSQGVVFLFTWVKTRLPGS